MMTEPRSGTCATARGRDPQLLLRVDHVAGLDHRLVAHALDRDRAAVHAAQQLPALQVREVAADRLGRHAVAPRQVRDVDRALRAARACRSRAGGRAGAWRRRGGGHQRVLRRAPGPARGPSRRSGRPRRCGGRRSRTRPGSAADARTAGGNTASKSRNARGSARAAARVAPRHVARSDVERLVGRRRRRRGSAPSPPAPWRRARSARRPRAGARSSGSGRSGNFALPSMHSRAIWSRTPGFAKRSSTEATYASRGVARDLVERRHGLAVEEAFEERAARPDRHRLVHERDAGQRREVGHARVPGVEQAELVELPVVDAVA